MTDRHMTLILGAGSSVELGLPTGKELKDQIASLLNFPYDRARKSGSPYIDRAFWIHAKQNSKGTIDEYLFASQQIRKAMPLAISIDNYLDTHQGDLYIELSGKLAIAQAILDSERNSKIYLSSSDSQKMLDFSQLQDIWYLKFFQLLTENCHVGDLPKRLSKLTVISFNYDRCFEHFLFYAIQNYYHIEQAEAAKILKSLEIFHPYGSLGMLPWTGNNDAVAFGAPADSDMLLKIASELRTFTEGTDPEKSDIEQLRDRLGNSDRIVFLGFAYHRLNLELLKTKHGDSSHRDVYGTAWEISLWDREKIENELNSLTPYKFENIELHNLKCLELLNRFSRSLTFSTA